MMPRLSELFNVVDMDDDDKYRVAVMLLHGMQEHWPIEQICADCLRGDRGRLNDDGLCFACFIQPIDADFVNEACKSIRYQYVFGHRKESPPADLAKRVPKTAVDEYNEFLDKQIATLQRQRGIDSEVKKEIAQSFRKTRYESYIASDTWKAKANYVKDRDGHRCVECGNTECLEVHHLTYARFADEFDTDLVTLCSNCHARRHGKSVSRQKRRVVYA